MGGKGVHHADMLGIGAVNADLDPFAFQSAEALVARFDIVCRAAGKLTQPDLMLAGTLVVFADDFCSVQRDFQPIGAGAVARGGDKGTGRAVGIFGVDGHVVFHFDIMPLALMAEGAYLARHAAKPLPQIQLVGALVEHDAAAFARPRGAPCAGIVVLLGTEPVRNDPAHAFHFAVAAVLHQLAYLAENAVCALVEHDCVCLVAVLCDLDQLVDLLCIDARGLFAHHMDAVLQRLDADRRMEIVGRGDDHRVHVAGSDQRGGVVVAMQSRAFCLCRLQTGGINVCNGGNVDFGQLTLQEVVKMRAAHVADADDA